MQTRTRKLFMALVGAYLVYMGIQLVNSVIKGNPQNKVLFIICGVVFSLFGAATIILNIREYIKAGKEEQEMAEESGEEVQKDLMVDMTEDQGTENTEEVSEESEETDAEDSEEEGK